MRLEVELCYSCGVFDVPGVPSQRPAGWRSIPRRQPRAATIGLPGPTRRERLSFDQRLQRWDHRLNNGSDTPAAATPPLEIIPLGGLGEFGMNMMVVACGDTAILIDAGVMFPEPELLGVDLIIPDLRQLQQYPIRAMVLTHGHEDHIGAVPHVMPVLEGPVYGTALTLALVEPKLGGTGATRRFAADPGGTARPRDRGNVHDRVPARHAQHPRLRGDRDHTPARRHAAHGRLQDRSDAARRRARRPAAAGGARAAGVLVLLSDSTNVDRRGFTGSERDVVDAFEEIFTSAQGALSWQPLRRACTGCSSCWTSRRSSTAGSRSSDGASSRIRRLRSGSGYLRIPPGIQIRDSEVRELSVQDVVCICTGSQGEPQAALPRIAIDDHRHVQLERDDVWCSRPGKSPATKKPSAG